MTLLDAHLRPAARLPVPVPPTAIQFAPDGASLFLALSSPTAPTVARLGRAGRAGAWQEGTALDGEGRRLRIAPDGLLAVVAVAGPLGGLALAHAPTLRVQGAMARCDARDVVLTPSADRALLICGEGQVTEVDLALRRAARTVPLPAARPCHPSGAALSSNGTVLLVACRTDGVVWYLDRARLTVLDSAMIPGGTLRMVTASRSQTALLVLADGSVALLDVPRRHVRVRTPPLGATDAAVTADERLLVATRDTLLELASQNGQVVQRVPLPEPGRLVAVWPGPDEPRLHWDPAVNATVSAVPVERS